jgi:hypothetical protein
VIELELEANNVREIGLFVEANQLEEFQTVQAGLEHVQDGIEDSVRVQFEESSGVRKRNDAF